MLRSNPTLKKPSRQHNSAHKKTRPSVLAKRKERVFKANLIHFKLDHTDYHGHRLY